MVKPLIDRLWEKTEVDDDGCWVFYGSRARGYGYIRISTYKTTRVHRASWTIHNGKIPDGIFVLHNCDNPACWNPEHLWLGTQLDNVHDCMNKNRFRSSIGIDNTRCALSVKDVLEIRRLLNEGKLSQPEIGARFLVTQSTVSDIKNGRSWNHI